MGPDTNALPVETNGSLLFFLHQKNISANNAASSSIDNVK